MFKLRWADVIQCRVPPCLVIPEQPVEGFILGLAKGFKVLPVQPLLVAQYRDVVLPGRIRNGKRPVEQLAAVIETICHRQGIPMERRESISPGREILGMEHLQQTCRGCNQPREFGAKLHFNNPGERSLVWAT